MSNFSLNCEYNSIRALSQERDKVHNIYNAINSQKFDSKSLWKVSWKGLTFSIKPFLCSGLCFLHDDTMRDALCELVLKYSDFDSLLKLTYEDYESMLSEDDDNVYRSLMYQLDSPIPCLVRYLVSLNDVNVAKKFMSLLMIEFIRIVDCDYMHVKFSDKSICNTEAFSYFLCMYWALQKSKKLQVLLSKEIRSANLNSLLESLCPETSIHWRYLDGELTSKQLFNGYSNSVGQVPVVFKEVFNLFSNGEVEFTSDYEILARNFLEGIHLNINFDDFKDVVHNLYFKMGVHDSFVKDLDDKIFVESDLRSENEILNKQVKELRGITKQQNKKISELESELDKTKNSFNSVTYEDTIANLNSTILTFKNEIIYLRGELEQSNSIIQSQKQDLRSKIKEIKSLNSRLVELEQLSSDYIDELDNVEDANVSFDNMLDFVKTKRIGVFGGYSIKDLSDRFSNYGVSIKHIVDDSQFDVGCIDCAVVLFNDIQHKTVYKLKSQYFGDIVYSSGSNVELIIKLIYEQLSKESENIG